MLALCAGVASFVLGPDQVGYSYEDVNGNVSVSAGTSPVILLTAFVIVLCYLVALDTAGQLAEGGDASTARRAGAWFIDFELSLSALASILGLVPVLREAVVTGHFQWRFVRPDSSPFDWILSLALVGAMFPGMALYWALPVVRGGQTIGQFMLNLRVIPVGSERLPLSKALIRGAATAFAPLLWLARLFSSEHSYWHDKITATRVIHLVRAGRGLPPN